MRVALALLVALFGCDQQGLAEGQPIDGDPEDARSPCFDVNLLDGLATEAPGELRALWRCLDLHDGFGEMERVVLALEESSVRTGIVAEFELARVVNQVAPSQDLVAWLQQAAHLLEEEDVFLLHVVHTLAEWTYGRPWPEVEQSWAAPGGPFAAPEATDAGLVAPLFGMLGTLGGAVLDGGRIPELAEALAELTAMPQLADVLDTAAEMVEGEQVVLFQNMPVASADYLDASVSPGGDNTLLGVLEPLLTGSPELGRTPLLAALPPVDVILDDVAARGNLVSALGGLYDDGLLDELPGQLHTLLFVDAAGQGLQPGEVNALESLFSLIERADAPVDCGLLTVDNLSVFILETIASWDPDNVALLIEASEQLVQLLADLGTVICNVDPQLDDHARSLVPLAQSGALRALIPMLDALDRADRVPELVELLATLERGDVVGPLSEHGRHVFDGPFLGNLLEILGAFVAPTQPVSSGDIDSILDLVDAIISPPLLGSHADSPLGMMIEPLRVLVVVESEPLSDWLQLWAVLLRSEGSESNEFFEHLAPLLAIDPELDFLATVGALVGQPEVLESLMLLADCDPVREAVASAYGLSPQEPGLLGLLGRTASDGSLEAALLLLSWTAEALDAIGLLDEEGT